MCANQQTNKLAAIETVELSESMVNVKKILSVVFICKESFCYCLKSQLTMYSQRIPRILDLTFSESSGKSLGRGKEKT